MARTALVVATTLAILAGGLWPADPVTASLGSNQTDIAGPLGSDEFGASVLALPSGNIVVTDPSYDSGATANVGAVYLYNGATGALISTLTGSTTYSQVGSGGLVLLENGNYVVLSPSWDSDGTYNTGAVTWGDGTTGVSGVVSSANSLVGTTAYDEVGSAGVTALTNGNYVVLSPDWHNGGAADAGAVTWGNGTTGTTGTVGASNSLVGSTASNQVGSGGVTELTNANYVVLSPYWDNGAVADAGAATWGDGTSGVSGVVSSANSLVGSTASDEIAWEVIPLTNGNYVVRSPTWDNGAVADAGAATWGNGTTGTTGVVSSANSLVGSTASDEIALEVMPLTNGNYVVLSLNWDNGAVADAGAATWGNGTTGTSGVVSSANSLVGTTANDMIAWEVTPLTNGNYVLLSPEWDNGAVANAGAATWGNGTTGTTGVVSSANSLVGSTAQDYVGGEEPVAALTNGNYVVFSPDWDNGAVADAGAATWGNGTTGVSGVVSSANSLVGSTADDRVGNEEATALTNGNYVVLSSDWHNGAGAATWGNGTTGTTGVVSSANSLVGSTADDRVGDWAEALTNGNYVVLSPHWDNNAGAATWGNGTTGTTGTVGASNSLVGSTADDEVGMGGVTVLTNGNYVVRSEVWNGAVADAGASTWGDGTTGVSGVVSSANSLVGSTAQDYVGGDQTALTNGHYVAVTRRWDNSTVVDAGAVTWGNGKIGATGTIRAENSVRGTPAGGGMTMDYDYDYTNDQLVVGRPAENIVTLFKPPSLETFLPLVLKKAS